MEYCCRKDNNKLPHYKSDDVFKKIMINHTDFYEQASKKYINLFPKGKKLMELLYKNKKSPD